MLYFMFLVIFFCIVNIVHARFILPSKREVILLEAQRALREADEISYVSQDNREYLDRMKEILQFIFHHNSEIGVIDYLRSSAVEISDKEKLSIPTCKHERVYLIEKKAVSLFYSSMFNNSFVLILYLLPFAVVVSLIKKLIDFLKHDGGEDSKTIDVYERTHRHQL